MDASFRNGWLVFETEEGTERRRLGQVPEDWAHLTPDHLARLCALAVTAPSAKSLSTAPTVMMPAIPYHVDSRRAR